MLSSLIIRIWWSQSIIPNHLEGYSQALQLSPRDIWWFCRERYPWIPSPELLADSPASDSTFPTSIGSESDEFKALSTNVLEHSRNHLNRCLGIFGDTAKQVLSPSEVLFPISGNGSVACDSLPSCRQWLLSMQANLWPSTFAASQNCFDATPGLRRSSSSEGYFPTGFPLGSWAKQFSRCITHSQDYSRMPASTTWISRCYPTSNPQSLLAMGCLLLSLNFLSRSLCFFHYSRFLRHLLSHNRLICHFHLDFWSFILFSSYFVFSTESPGSSLSFPSRSISRPFLVSFLDFPRPPMEIFVFGLHPSNCFLQTNWRHILSLVAI